MKLSKILKQCNTNFHCENFFDFNVFDISSNSRIIKIIIFLLPLGAKDN